MLFVVVFWTINAIFCCAVADCTRRLHDTLTSTTKQKEMGPHFLLVLCLGVIAFVLSAIGSLPILMTAELRAWKTRYFSYLNNDMARKARGADHPSVSFGSEGTMDEERSTASSLAQYQFHNFDTRDWNTDELCHTPIDPIISKTRVLFDPQNIRNSTARVLNMGMPKSGSSSVSEIFTNSGFKTSHWGCGRGKGACGHCFERHLNTTDDIFRKCGNHNVFTQMDQMWKKGCIFPQIKYLDKLYEDAPHATWLMPLRNVSAWLDSVNRWNDMRRRYRRCNFSPYLDFQGHGDEKSDQKMMAMYCNHVQQIRQFVVEHPTLSLVEFRIENPNAGSFLAQYLPVDAAQWGKNNVNEK